MYVAKERIHITRDNKLVRPGDRRSASLLVPQGGELSDEAAEKYGLYAGQPIPWLSQEEEVLPLDSKPAEVPPPSNQPAPLSPPPNELAGSFPAHIQLGTPPQQAGGAVLDSGTPPPTPPAPSTTQQTAPPPPATPTTSVNSDLPDDFPYKSILVGAGLVTKEQLKGVTKDHLITVPQIGSARADEILAARDKLQ